jgi:hypothetical protein
MASGKFSEIIVDATNLEINSILVDGISGRKMPGVTPAFLETMSAFVFQFRALENRLRLDRIKVDPDHPMIKAAERWTQEKKSLFEKYVFKKTGFSDFSTDNLVSGVLNIDAMSSFRKAAAGRMKGKPNADNHNAELFRLLRLQTRMMVLKNRLAAAETLDLRDMQELRKLWELKDGFIYAQNVVQLDGDIINRSNLRLYRDRRIKENTIQLLEFHRKNVDVGIKHWHFIIKTIVSIAKAVGETIVNPFK